jgi:hypothetical protein
MLGREVVECQQRVAVLSEAFDRGLYLARYFSAKAWIAASAEARFGAQ